MGVLIQQLNRTGQRLSKSHRKLAEYIEEHYDTAVRMTASRLGECVGVSESTVVRFATALGYEGYPQLENGVGLLRSLETDFRYALEKDGPVVNAAPFSIATGLAAEPYIRELVELAGAPGIVYGVPNDFFGHTIDVAGLLTGQDLIAHLKGKDLGQRLLLPGVMLRDGEGVFLDDLTTEDLERELGVEVRSAPCDGNKLLAAMKGQF